MTVGLDELSMVRCPAHVRADRWLHVPVDLLEPPFDLEAGDHVAAAPAVL